MAKQRHLIMQLGLADYTTLLAAALCIAGYWLLWLGHIYAAVSIVFVSMFFDYLDGVIARKYGGSPYGKMLDSLYDVLGWVLFPALIINIQAGWKPWSIIITTVYCLAAMVRLSRFTAEGYIENNKRYYRGLPVLFSKYALILAFVLQANISLLILTLMIPLMVSDRLIAKPPAWAAWLNLAYAALFVILLIR